MGNFVQRHAHSIATRHKVEVLVCIPDPSRKQPEVETVQNGKLLEHRVYYPGSGMRAAFKAFRAGVTQCIQDREDAFDLVHHNVLHTAGWQARWLQKKCGLPYVLTEHWNGFHNGWYGALPFRRRLLIRAAAKGASMLCPVSEHLAAAMQRCGLKSNYTVVPNVVDTELFTLGSRPTVFKCVHVSHLGDDHKNVSGMLRVLKRVLDAGMSVELDVIGDGDIEPHVATATKLGITQAVSFRTEQPIQEIAKAMRQASALLLFSNYENLPCVIVEAFASGIPVISTDVGGIAEHVQPGRGVLVEKGDEDALFEALMAFDPANYPASDLRSYAVNHFSTGAVAAAYTQVYQTALA